MGHRRCVNDFVAGEPPLYSEDESIMDQLIFGTKSAPGFVVDV